MIENPYFFRGPVTDERYFFGRTQETRRLLRALRGGQSVSIVGPRRIGKSSLLVHIQNKDTLAAHGLDAQFTLLYIDCQESTEWDKTHFYRRLCDEIERRLGIYSTFTSRRATTFADFTQTVNDAVDQGFHLVFLFDEFEVMAANRNLDAKFFSQLRGFVGRKVSFVTASQTDLYDLTQQTALNSPFFNSFFTMPLGLFKRSEALKLATELSKNYGQIFDPKTINYILRMAGHHPFFLQITCDAVFEYQTFQPTLDDSDYTELSEEIQQQLEPHFKYYWYNISADERQALIALSAEEDVRHLKTQLLKLEKQCFVVRNNGHFQFVSTSFGRFVREQSETMAFPTPPVQMGTPHPVPDPEASAYNTKLIASKDRPAAGYNPALHLTLAGVQLGSYKLLEKIGEGGMASVYKAHQRSLDRPVAVKVLEIRTARDAEAYERFAREAQAIAGLTHRNILPIYEFGQKEGIAYIAMQYVANGTFRDQIRQGGLKFGTIRAVFEQISQALQYAHQRGIVHRDIKPANILIADENWALLADFGLVKILEDTAQLTHSGYTVGTPYYMSPEQVVGKEIDSRSDIYSLGAVLYEAVTKRPPFSRKKGSLDVLLMKKNGEMPILPSELVPNLPPTLERLILKAMSIRPEDRFQTVLEMNQALQALR